MSEVTLTILDSSRAITGNMHGAVADWAIAALAAEPETIEELDHAMRRFSGNDDRSHFAHFRSGDSDEPWDAGIVVIDLVARLLAGESTYSAIITEGSVEGRSREEDHWINYRLADDWVVVHHMECWRGMADKRRRERAAIERIDAREVLYGRPMCKFVAQNMAATRGTEAEEAVRKVHADWLLTSRDDLGGQSPREVLLARKKFIDFDLQDRGHQWSMEGTCPTPLDRDTAAYKYAGFGTHEIVTYYEWMRSLLWFCRERLDSEGELNTVDEARRLARLGAELLETPDPEFHGRTPASIIDNERRRMPEAMSGAEAMVDPDCPCCQAMAELDFGPMFWHLDGCNMDDDFAFSFHTTVEEWEEEQREWKAWSEECDRRWAERERDRDAAETIWERTFASEEFDNQMPLSQLVPVASFGFAAMVGEINQDIHEQASAPQVAAAEQETLNRLLGNLRDALGGNADLIDPALDRLVDELCDVGARYPTIEPKCADLSRRLAQFPEKLAKAAKWEDEIPF